MLDLRVLPTRNGGIIRRFVFKALRCEDKFMLLISNAYAEDAPQQAGGGVEMMVMIGVFFPDHVFHDYSATAKAGERAQDSHGVAQQGGRGGYQWWHDGPHPGRKRRYCAYRTC